MDNQPHQQPSKGGQRDFEKRYNEYNTRRIVYQQAYMNFYKQEYECFKKNITDAQPNDQLVAQLSNELEEGVD